MGSEAALPRINEVSNFLAKYAPAVQEKWTRGGGEGAALVQAGTLGGKDATAIEDRRERLIVRARVVSDALSAAIERSTQDVQIVSKRLAMLRRLRYFNTVFGVVASSGVIGAIFVGKGTTLAAATLSVLSSIAGLTADNLVLGRRGSEQSLREIGETLARTLGEGRLVADLLRTMQSIQFDPEEMKRIIQEANALFAQLNRSLASLVTNA
jgi:hypothetical protein